MIERIGKAQRWSDAVAVNGLVFLAGHVADKTRGQPVAAQTEDVLAQMDETLAKAGITKANLVSVTIYLADMAGFDEMNSVWDRWVDSDNPPARATVESRLAYPDFAVEMTAIAAR
ncbi:enamine deaminase RidA (YjgF/YER057c/UK114 family) [Nitrospirillum amazonense]|uniref:Enamine deaminase RidA (YjgF/YER057c/UK114 family) n=1 Tax=Nitrospirillum amazonense TaxID=28077 RepID=A0A560EWA8_9PROT|nr:RidA family protein [Nitrospirillum amazonense]TWB13662.1 enamine deaminase RidA (YjgF/YER057c/UK114 family) [Nitrospirillum amazonense]